MSGATVHLGPVDQFLNVSGTPVDNQVAVWTGANTLEGDANLTWDGEDLLIIGDMDLVHLATEEDEHAFEIDCDAAGHADVKAIDIDYITGAIISGEDEGVILVNIDEVDAAGGDISALEVLATEGGADRITGLFAGGLVGPIEQISGVFSNPASALNVAVDVLAAVSSGGAGAISMFVADNDTITIGSAAKFEELEFIIATGASGAGIQALFEYSTGSGTWATFGPVDGTNDFRNTGVVAWLDEDIPSWAVGLNTEFLIRITRQRNSLATTPIVDTVQVLAGTIFSWDKLGDVVVNNITSANGVTKVGTPVDNEIGVWTGDGTLEGDTNFTWDGTTVTLAGTIVATSDNFKFIQENQVGNEAGLMMYNTFGSTSRYSWMPGYTGFYQDHLLLIDDPTDSGNNRAITMPTGSAPAFGNGCGVADSKSFQSLTSAALAYWQVARSTGNRESVHSVRSAAGSGNQSQHRHEHYTYGDSGLSLDRVFYVYVDRDYRAHVDFQGIINIGGGVEATDVEAGEKASIGYGAVTGIEITGQGSTNDVTIYNDANTEVMGVLTGTTTADFKGIVTALTFEPDGDTAADDNAAIGYTAAEGVIITGQGSTNDLTIKNDADTEVLGVLTGTTTVQFAGIINAGGHINAAGYVQLAAITDAQLNDITHAINTDTGKVQGAMVYNLTQDVPVWSVGIADGSVWVDGAGTTVNTPV